MSAARFNPPPNWPVPRGWDPPPDWQPDPSWPPAPAGWQFWGEDVEHIAYPAEPWEPEAEPARSGRRKFILIAVAAAVVVALVGGTVAVVSWIRDEPASMARPAGMLPGTYPTMPAIDWSVDVTEVTGVGDGPEPAFTSPEYGPAFYASVGAVVAGDHVVVHAVPDRSSPDKAQMMSINVNDGRVEWTRPSNARDGCALDLVGDLLPCRSYDNYGAVTQVDFIDVGTGEVRSSASAPFFVNMLASDGTSVYLAGHRESDGLVVSKGSVEDPMSDWQVSIRGEACDIYGGGDAYDMQVRDGIVFGFQGGGAEIALRASDGSPIFDHAVSDVVVFEGPTVTARRCIAGADMDQWPTEVADGGGTELFTVGQRLTRRSLDIGAGAPGVLITNGGDALDAATGKRLWSKTDWPTEYSVSAVIGDVLLYTGNGSDVLHAAALGTGEELWGQPPAGQLERNALTDGRNLVVVDDGEIHARSLADGATVWSKRLPFAAEHEMVTLTATDHGLLYVSGRQIGLLRPTGPAAPLPGSGEDADEDGGTTLITRCGTPPTFEPQEITTESGELVITMRIVAKCAGGDVLSSPRTSISVTTGDGQNVASAVFDLSADPVVIGPNNSGFGDEPSVTHRLRFPAGTFWRLPVSLDEAPNAGATQKGRVDLDAATLLVDCVTDGAGEESAKPERGSEASTATGPAPPPHGDNQSASFDALRAIANADRPFVTQQLADRWVPQLSSKRPGLVAEGMTWDNASTLREHLDLRLKYPEVRLLWSGDWSVFSAQDFWVTIAGVTFPDAGDALAWCRNNGLDRDHCYAKLVSAHHPVEGSTAFNN